MTTIPRGRTSARSLLAASVGVASIMLAAACGSGFLRGLVGGAADAGPDADSAAPSICFDPLPDRPDASDSPTQLDLTFAVEDFRLDTADRDASLPAPEGRDLDRTCTCPGPPSCKAPSDQTPNQRCDGPRGRDNAFGGLANQASGLVLAADFGVYIRGGGFTTLIDVQQWNGEADDPVVSVSVRASQGLESHATGGTEPAKLDGTDVWTVDPSSLLDGEQRIGQSCETRFPAPCLPRFRDPNGYVRDGKLIAGVDFPFEVTTPSGHLVLEMKQVKLIASITKVGASYRLAGEIVGRFPAARLLSNLAALRDPVTGKALCGNATYGALKAALCSATDIGTDPAADGSEAPCDALSGAIRFVAGPAHAGLVFAGDKASSECIGFQDSCAK